MRSREQEEAGGRQGREKTSQNSQSKQIGDIFLGMEGACDIEARLSEYVVVCLAVCARGRATPTGDGAAGSESYVVHGGKPCRAGRPSRPGPVICDMHSSIVCWLSGSITCSLSSPYARGSVLSRRYIKERGRSSICLLQQGKINGRPTPM